LESYTIENKNLKALVCPFGATLHQLLVNTVNGWINVLQHCNNTSDYENDPWYKGAVIGPVAGRLRQPVIVLEQELDFDDFGQPLLHSGSSGWSHKMWKVIAQDTVSLTLSLHTKETQSPFPGDVTAEVHYQLIENSLQLTYRASTSKPSPVNMTNHSYFNLAPMHSFEDHLLHITSNERLEVDQNQLPTGNTLLNTEQAFAYQTPKSISQGSLDDYFLLTAKPTISLCHPAHSLKMEVTTDQKGIVVFTPESFPAVCLETQAAPDALYHPHFEDIIHAPENEYTHKTIFSFSTLNNFKAPA